MANGDLSEFEERSELEESVNEFETLYKDSIPIATMGKGFYVDDTDFYIRLHDIKEKMNYPDEGREHSFVDYSSPDEIREDFSRFVNNVKEYITSKKKVKAQ